MFPDGFEKIKEKSAEVAAVAARKVNLLKDIARTKSSRAAVDTQMRELQIELAEMCYKDCMQNGTVDRNQYQTLCERIHKAKRKIEKLDQLTERLKAQLLEREAEE